MSVWQCRKNTIHVLCTVRIMINHNFKFPTQRNLHAGSKTFNLSARSPYSTQYNPNVLPVRKCRTQFLEQKLCVPGSKDDGPHILKKMYFFFHGYFASCHNELQLYRPKFYHIRFFCLIESEGTVA